MIQQAYYFDKMKRKRVYLLYFIFEIQCTVYTKNINELRLL